MPGAALARHAGASLAALAALPLLAATLAARPTLRSGLAERFGARPRHAPGGVWVHAASIGEVRAAGRLIERLLARGVRVTTSTLTLTGREVMHAWRADVPCHLAPLDHPWCVGAAFARLRPDALVLVETELWPSLIAGASRRGVPIVLVSGRVSDRSYPRYRRLAPLLARSLRRLAAVGARTEVDADRFRRLGAPAERVFVTGDIKLDLDEDPPKLAPELAWLLGTAPLVVAGSTHAGEEAAALDALEAAERAGLAPALVIAPRHPARAAEVERLARQRRREVRRRSGARGTPLSAGEVLVLDSVGELSALYARADVAFVGGTLEPVGGHNVLEPVAAGRAVLFGPHTANVRHAVKILERCGAGRSVRDGTELAAAVVEWLREPDACLARGAEGLRTLREHRGSAERATALVEAALARHAGA